MAPVKEEPTTTAAATNDDSEIAVATATAAAVAAVADAATIQEAAATTAAMGIMMMDPTSSAAADDTEQVVAPGLESTGRWTKFEHAKFLQGIEKYGKEWKKVAAFVKTRTVMQTRTHAQKYYEKLSLVALRATGSPLPSKSTSATKPIKIDLSVHPTATTTAAAAAAKKAPLPSSAFGASATINSAAMVVPPIPVVSFTEYDILVPINDATASRPSNKVYMDIMKMNCFIFHSLPITEQLWFARNIVHYLSSVRHHRWIGCNYYGAAPQYQILPEPVSVVQSDFRMDPLKVAAFAFHPFWLLGDHDSTNIHNGHPFIHRTVDGSWKPVTMAQVKDILKGEGPKNLLLLPASIPTMEPASTATTTTSTTTPAEEAKEEVPVDTVEETKDEPVIEEDVAIQEEEAAAEEEDVAEETKEEAEAIVEETIKEAATVVVAPTKKTATTAAAASNTKSKAVPATTATASSKRTTTAPAATTITTTVAERRSKRSKI